MTSTKCPNCGLIDGHANRCFADVLISELLILRRCKAALEEMEAAYKSDRGITLSETVAIMKKGLHGERKEEEANGMRDLRS
jgi:hypothetical protein